MRIKSIWPVIALLLSPLSCFAEEMSAKSPIMAGAGSHMSFSYVMQILISFVVVIAFILGLAMFMKKTGRFGYGGGQLIKVKSSLSLGMREKILLVEVGDANIVVGVAPGQIRTLHVLQSGIQVESPHGAGETPGGKGFKQLMDKFAAR